MTEDPIGLAGGINLYAYCANSPTNYSDPSGLSPEYIMLWLVPKAAGMMVVSALIEGNTYSCCLKAISFYSILKKNGFTSGSMWCLTKSTAYEIGTGLVQIGLLGMNDAGEQIDKDTFTIGFITYGFAIYGGFKGASSKVAPKSSAAVQTSTKVSHVANATVEKMPVKQLRRPYIRKATRLKAEANARRTPDGRFRDVNTGEPIDGKYHLGHRYDYEFWRMRNRAMAKGLTQKEFNDLMNNPDFYQIEDPISNMGHKFEKPR